MSTYTLIHPSFIPLYHVFALNQSIGHGALEPSKGASCGSDRPWNELPAVGF